MANERIILGIDPGTTIMGFGLIKVVNKKMEFIQLNELILSKYDDHYTKLKVIFESGNLEEFIKIVESEALTLHAMMMTSMPYFILMKPNTLEIINAIWKFRNETNIPVCFTLDAGANVHVLYPNNVKEEVLSFIKNELVRFCQNSQYICDEIGSGAVKL